MPFAPLLVLRPVYLVTGHSCWPGRPCLWLLAVTALQNQASQTKVQPLAFQGCGLGPAALTFLYMLKKPQQTNHKTNFSRLTPQDVLQCLAECQAGRIILLDLLDFDYYQILKPF